MVNHQVDQVGSNQDLYPKKSTEIPSITKYHQISEVAGTASDPKPIALRAGSPARPTGSSHHQGEPPATAAPWYLTGLGDNP
jgi:hypothetical protein